MSAGKSDVVAYVAEDRHSAYVFHANNHEFLEAYTADGFTITPLVPESLLLDARAEVEAKDCEIMGDLMKLRFAYERIDELEALAGEYERDARRYRFLRDQGTYEILRPFICIFAGSFSQWTGEHADLQIDTAIDAVGGRGYAGGEHGK